tara:strand:+ start:188 stop:415 length:228 start_codon:yes stop_codon:yes gene_type:complete
MCELNIIYLNYFWYYVDENERINTIESLPLRTKLLRKFYNDIIDIYHEKKKYNSNLRLVFEKDEENLWILHTLSD